METAMTKEVAEYIKELRMGRIMHSWRRIAELVCVEYPSAVEELGWDVDASGNQSMGVDLCKEAAKVLGLEEID
jgi:hypothetical protein